MAILTRVRPGHMFLLAVAAVVQTACAPAVTQKGESKSTLSRTANCELIILGPDMRVSPGAGKFGQVSIGDTGVTTDCSQSRVVEILRETACQRGADLAKITVWKAPDGWSTCFRLRADLYSLHAENWESLPFVRSEFEEHLDQKVAAGELEEIEGIWASPDGTYELGVMVDSDSPARDFVGFILESKYRWWKPGQVKLELDRTANPGVYMGSLFAADRRSVATLVHVDENGLLQVKFQGEPDLEDGLFVRKAPLTESSAVQRRPSTAPAEVRIAGSCFVVSPNGHILTNHHVIDGGSKIAVQLSDGRRFDAAVVADSALTDLAVLQIPMTNIAYLPLSDMRSARVGMEVFTMGYPVTSILGSEPKFTDGTVSALSGVQGESSLLQISVPIQPGNSGGPLVNNSGEVVGIITSTAAVESFIKASGSLPQNVNWAVKSDYALLMIDQPEPLRKTASRTEAIERTKEAVCRVEVR